MRLVGKDKLGERDAMSKAFHKKDEFTILTVPEVADYLRLSEAKVYRLVRAGRLPVVRIGKAWRFRKDLLDNWLCERTESCLKTEDS
jgi:excisionase family DNA binding protein